eukprot:8403606-Pyramimonas_sp.AAC.1
MGGLVVHMGVAVRGCTARAAAATDPSTDTQTSCGVTCHVLKTLTAQGGDRWTCGWRAGSSG